MSDASIVSDIVVGVKTKQCSAPSARNRRHTNICGTDIEAAKALNSTQQVQLQAELLVPQQSKASNSKQVAKASKSRKSWLMSKFSKSLASLSSTNSQSIANAIECETRKVSTAVSTKLDGVAQQSQASEAKQRPLNSRFSSKSTADIVQLVSAASENQLETRAVDTSALRHQHSHHQHRQQNECSCKCYEANGLQAHNEQQSPDQSPLLIRPKSVLGSASAELLAAQKSLAVAAAAKVRRARVSSSLRQASNDLNETVDNERDDEHDFDDYGYSYEPGDGHLAMCRGPQFRSEQHRHIAPLTVKTCLFSNSTGQSSGKWPATRDASSLLSTRRLIGVAGSCSQASLGASAALLATNETSDACTNSVGMSDSSPSNNGADSDNSMHTTSGQSNQTLDTNRDSVLSNSPLGILSRLLFSTNNQQQPQPQSRLRRQSTPSRCQDSPAELGESRSRRPIVLTSSTSVDTAERATDADDSMAVNVDLSRAASCCDGITVKDATSRQRADSDALPTVAGMSMNGLPPPRAPSMAQQHQQHLQLHCGSTSTRPLCTTHSLSRDAAPSSTNARIAAAAAAANLAASHYHKIATAAAAAAGVDTTGDCYPKAPLHCRQHSYRDQYIAENSAPPCSKPAYANMTPSAILPALKLSSNCAVGMQQLSGAMYSARFPTNRYPNTNHQLPVTTQTNENLFVAQPSAATLTSIARVQNQLQPKTTTHTTKQTQLSTV